MQIYYHVLNSYSLSYRNKFAFADWSAQLLIIHDESSMNKTIAFLLLYEAF